MSFTLAEAQNYAIENYFLTKNAELDVESAKKRIMETAASGLPQVKATADFQYVPNPPVFEFPNPDNPAEIMEIPLVLETNMTYGATVSQLIFSGEYIVGLQASRVYKALAEENYDKAKIDLRENIAGTYFGILILENNRIILEKTLDNLQSNLEQTIETYKAGLAEDTDVDQLELTVKRTENDLTTLDNQIETMRKLLKYQMGLPAGVKIQLTEEVDALVAKNIVSDSVYIFNLQENINYQMLETQERLQKLNMNRYKSTYLPTISGFYNYSDQTESSEFSQAVNHVLGIQASWPIFQSGMRNAQVAQARISYEQALNMKQQEAERLYLAAEQAKNDYQTALNKYYNEKQNFDLSEKVFEKTTEKFDLGMVSSLELSLINTQFLQAQLSYSMAIQELLQSKVAMDKAFNKL
jgi:outer membrane protein TolC